MVGPCGGTAGAPPTMITWRFCGGGRSKAKARRCPRSGRPGSLGSFTAQGSWVTRQPKGVRRPERAPCRIRQPSSRCSPLGGRRTPVRACRGLSLLRAAASGLRASLASNQGGGCPALPRRGGGIASSPQAASGGSRPRGSKQRPPPPRSCRPDAARQSGYMKIKKDPCWRPHVYWGSCLNFLSGR